MCGIAGFLSHENKGESLSLAISQLFHRGPDEQVQKLFVENEITCGLAMSRLAIVDINEGHQPYWNEDQSLAVVFNGEIYNHLDLKRKLEKMGHQLRSSADGEVISHLYEEFGLDFVHELDGMFAIAIWDLRLRKIIAVRDRFGKKPLFFFQKNGEFFFSSEIKSLRTLIGTRRLNVSQVNLHELMSIGFVRAPMTIYEDIFQLRAGELLITDGETVERRKYWLPASQRSHQSTFETPTLNDIETALESAVLKRIPLEVDFGIFLSGGIDSSLVAALASKVQPKGVPSFSVAFDDEHLDETLLATETAKKLNLDHKILRFSEQDAEDIWVQLPDVFDSPNLDSSIFPMLFLSAEAAKSVRVILTGDGGDELFGGYRKYELMAYLLRLGRMLRKLSLTESCHGSISTMRPIALLQAAASGPLSLSQEFNSQYVRRGELGINPRRIIEPHNSGISENNFILDSDLEFYLPGILHKVDSGTMWNSIEARSPLLDRHLYEISRHLQPDMQFGRKGTKLALRAIASSYLPENVRNAPKKGFTPNRTKLLKTGIKMGLGRPFDEEDSKLADLLGLKLQKEKWESMCLDKRMERLVWTLVVVEQWLRKWT